MIRSYVVRGEEVLYLVDPTYQHCIWFFLQLATITLWKTALTSWVTRRNIPYVILVDVWLIGLIPQCSWDIEEESLIIRICCSGLSSSECPSAVREEIKLSIQRQRSRDWTYTASPFKARLWGKAQMNHRSSISRDLSYGIIRPVEQFNKKISTPNRSTDEWEYEPGKDPSM